MLIYLIRHGESIANAKGIYQGQSYDTPLSKLGKKQASSVIPYFDDKEIKSIYSSPLKRTFQTADILAEDLDLGIILDKLIMEINHGRWEGKCPEEFIQADKKLLKQYKSNPDTVFMPGGEHTLDVLKRTDQFLDEIETESLPAAVVTHDLVIRMFIVRVLGLPVHNIWKFRLDNCGVTTIDLATKTLLTLNENSHLLGVQTAVNAQAL